MRPFSDRVYEKVRDENLDANSTDEQSQSTEHSENGRWFGYNHGVVISMAVGLVFLLLLLLGVCLYELRLVKHAPVPPHSNGLRVCGNSRAEAVALGCTFDQMTWSWLSPKCPRYASDEYLAADDWKYYEDPYNRVLVSSENWTMALDNQVPLYTERREHLSHCLYTFLSLSQIIRDGTAGHPRLSSYEHIKHCVHVVLESVKRDKDWYTVDADMGRVSFDEGC